MALSERQTLLPPVLLTDAELQLLVSLVGPQSDAKHGEVHGGTRSAANLVTRNLTALGILKEGAAEEATAQWQSALDPLVDPERILWTRVVGENSETVAVGARRGDAAVWIESRGDEHFILPTTPNDLADCILGSLELPNVLSDEAPVVAISAELLAAISDDPAAADANHARLTAAGIPADVAARVANALASRKRTSVMFAIGRSGEQAADFDELAWFETKSGDLWLSAFSEDRSVAYVSPVSTYALLDGIRGLAEGPDRAER